MKKGFTLVEVLAVVTVLGLLALLIIPTIDSVIKSNKNDAYEIELDNIKDGLKSYVAENLFEMPKIDGESKEVTLKDVVDAGFLSPNISNPKNDKCFSEDMVLVITRKNNDFTYTIMENTITSVECTN